MESKEKNFFIDPTILIVDDDCTFTTLLEQVLKDEGHKVLVAHSGQQALTLAERSPDQIDAILLDINMIEMNGLEVARRLRSSPSASKIPIAFVSVWDKDLLFKKTPDFSSLCEGFLAKPFDLSELFNLVNSLVRQNKKNMTES